MPTYQYRCTQCGSSLEKFQSFSEAALTECPTCAQPTLKRVLHAAGIVFKGSGWYITDSRKDSGSSNSSTDGNTDNSKPNDSNSTESKPAESKPAESKPAESKPAESKPAEKTTTTSAPSS